MRSRIRPLASWFVGMLGLVFIVWHFPLSDFGAQIAKVGLPGCSAWLFLTSLARFALVEVTVRPLRGLGFDLRRSDAFWIGWIRTFANQIVPLSGLALFTRELRRKTQVPWSGLVALSAPMLLFAASALSVLGLVAVSAGSTYLGSSTIPMLLVFILLGAGSALAATHAAWVLDRLPGALSLFGKESADAFRRLSVSQGLVLQIIGFHLLAMILRGGRIWLLFMIVGVELPVSGALLVAVMAESAALFQLTPGGLGLREGAIIGGAALLGVSTELGAVVALIDRLFLVAITGVLAVPGFWIIRR